MDIEELRELVKLFEESNITEMNIERDGVSVHLKKESGAVEGSIPVENGPVTQSIQWQSIEEPPGNDETDLEENALVTDAEYRAKVEEFGPGSFEASMGAEAIRRILEEMDIEDISEQLRFALGETNSEAKRKKPAGFSGRA